MAPRKKPKREYTFINRDIIAGLILAMTMRPRPTDDELNNNADQIALWNKLYDISDKLKAMGWSSDMPLEWLRQEFPKIIYVNLENPNAIYPPAVHDLYHALQDAAPIIDSITVTDEELMPLDNPLH